MTQHPTADIFQEDLTLYALGLLDSEDAAATEVSIRARGLRATQALRAIEGRRPQVWGSCGPAPTDTPPALV